jgi:hypothetical protein
MAQPTELFVRGFSGSSAELQQLFTPFGEVKELWQGGKKGGQLSANPSLPNYGVVRFVHVWKDATPKSPQVLERSLIFVLSWWPTQDGKA